ncbi:hypothetical protein DL96DRAFT_1710297 [Flagelloscypha sp. PMI_526]|nr:hypothetical protein DL96DRAFT_1710297 [Flagelloscypha sp. PMI_526]
MTRTARSSSLKALIKDRSESRNNRDQSLRKGGAGQHNWGAMRDEGQYNDDEFDEQPEEDSAGIDSKPETTRRASDEDIASAKQFRKHALNKDGLDLASIARTSSAVSSSPEVPSPIAANTTAV